MGIFKFSTLERSPGAGKIIIGRKNENSRSAL